MNRIKLRPRPQSHFTFTALTEAGGGVRRGAGGARVTAEAVQHSGEFLVVEIVLGAQKKKGLEKIINNKSDTRKKIN